MCSDHVSRGEMAHTCLEQVLLDGPLHEIVVDARFGDAFVVGNRLIVVLFQSGEVGDFEVKFV